MSYELVRFGVQFKPFDVAIVIKPEFSGQKFKPRKKKHKTKHHLSLFGILPAFLVLKIS